MTEAISGAYHGIDSIPERWKKKLEKADYIKELAEKLWSIHASREEGSKIGKRRREEKENVA